MVQGPRKKHSFCKFEAETIPFNFYIPIAVNRAKACSSQETTGRNKINRSKVCIGHRMYSHTFSCYDNAYQGRIYCRKTLKKKISQTPNCIPLYCLAQLCRQSFEASVQRREVANKKATGMSLDGRAWQAGMPHKHPRLSTNERLFPWTWESAPIECLRVRVARSIS